jgi:hypothetical protein
MFPQSIKRQMAPAERGIADSEALEKGLKEKSAEFVEEGAEVERIRSVRKSVGWEASAIRTFFE